jgi:hypothetical protein
VPDGAEYVMFETIPRVAGKCSWYHYGSGESHAELKDDLDQSLGLPEGVSKFAINDFG